MEDDEEPMSVLSDLPLWSTQTSAEINQSSHAKSLFFTESSQTCVLAALLIRARMITAVIFVE